jgi:hypothetical protein
MAGTVPRTQWGRSSLPISSVSIPASLSSTAGKFSKPCIALREIASTGIGTLTWAYPARQGEQVPWRRPLRPVAAAQPVG